jgi:hypothetical protein
MVGAEGTLGFISGITGHRGISAESHFPGVFQHFVMPVKLWRLKRLSVAALN